MIFMKISKIEKTRKNVVFVQTAKVGAAGLPVNGPSEQLEPFVRVNPILARRGF